MTGMIHRFPFDRKLPDFFKLARRMRRAETGIAAVEFALILPMLLALYFGCVVLAQGLDVGRKTQLLSRTLADITSQQLPGQQAGGNCANYASNPCLNDSDFIGNAGTGGIFNSATQVLFPFWTSTNTNMTISEIVFDNVGGNGSNATECCQARVVWSIGSGPSPTLRACSTGSSPTTTPYSSLTPSANGTNGAGLMPMGVYPGGAGDVLTSNAPSTGTGNTADTYVIVADVSVSYKPGFGFNPNNWSQSPNGGNGYLIAQSTYMTPRNGAATPIVWANGGTIPAGQAVDCVGSSGSDTYGSPKHFNVP
jgi:Flp pilus assembly protein TadG